MEQEPARELSAARAESIREKLWLKSARRTGSAAAQEWSLRKSVLKAEDMTNLPVDVLFPHRPERLLVPAEPVRRTARAAQSATNVSVVF